MSELNGRILPEILVYSLYYCVKSKSPRKQDSRQELIFLFKILCHLFLNYIFTVQVSVFKLNSSKFEKCPCNVFLFDFSHPSSLCVCVCVCGVAHVMSTYITCTLHLILLG